MNITAFGFTELSVPYTFLSPALLTRKIKNRLDLAWVVVLSRDNRRKVS